MNQKSGSGPGPFRGAIDRSFQQDAIRTDKSGDMRGRKLWMEIALRREESEKEKESEGNPGSQSGSF
jgi:hypothetical protein